MFEKLDRWFDKCERLDTRLMKVSQKMSNWWTRRTGRSNFDFAYLCAALGFISLGALAADLLNMSDPFTSVLFGPLLMVDVVLYGAILGGLMRLEEDLKPTLKVTRMNPLRPYKWGGVCRMTVLFVSVIIVSGNVLNHVFGPGMRWQAIPWALSFALLSYFASCTPSSPRLQELRALRRR